MPEFAERDDTVGDSILLGVDYAFNMKGKPIKETSATMTLTLHKGATGWRLTGWAWSKS